MTQEELQGLLRSLQIHELIARFNFNHVRRSMIALDWAQETESELPTEHELRETARKLLQQIAESPMIKSIYSGGLRASREDLYDTLVLEFIVERSVVSINRSRSQEEDTMTLYCVRPTRDSRNYVINEQGSISCRIDSLKSLFPSIGAAKVFRENFIREWPYAVIMEYTGVLPHSDNAPQIQEWEDEFESEEDEQE